MWEVVPFLRVYKVISKFVIFVLGAYHSCCVGSVFDMFIVISAKATYIEHISLVFFRLQYHPDMNKSPEAEEKFKEISAAYEVIFCLWLQLKC